MMKRLCQIQRLEAKGGMKKILEDKSTEEQDKNHRGRPTKINDALYNRLLNHARALDPTVCDYRQLPHAEDANILRPNVLIRATLDVCEKTRVSVLPPNNCVVIKRNGIISYGLVNEILVYTHPGQGLRAVCEIIKISNLFCKVKRSPTTQFRFWLYTMKAVVGCVEQNVELVPAEAIANLAAYRRLPSGIFGLKNGIILTPVNRLGSLEINPVAT